MRPTGIHSLASLAILLTVYAIPHATIAAELTGSAPLRAAIEDMQAEFGDRYPHAEAYLTRLATLDAQATAQDALDPATAKAFQQLQREALLANPLVAGQPLLFVVREQYRNDHHNTATMFQTGEINTGSFRGGSALKVIDLADGAVVTTLLELKDGVARDPDVHFDGDRILFSMRHDIRDDYHLYEIGADGGELTQLTTGSGISDIDPIYLPSGQIMMTSTREPKFCMCNRHIMGNLFIMNGDGSNIQQIGHSTLHEGHPVLMPDGRVIYDRWEYVDRNFGDAQGVWTVNPDGTNHAVYWGNNTNSPGGVLDTRIVPGTDLAVATFSSCHDRPWGAIALIDRRLGMDGKKPVLQTWPPEAIDLVEVGNYDTFIRVGKKYEDPYPLSEKYYLASGMTGQGEQMGIWLLDTFGNELLIHVEGAGCFDPMPLASRVRPPVIPSRIDLTGDSGHFYIADVYQGTGMEQIDRGTVKTLRVVESPEKRFWTREAWNGSGTQAPGMSWDDFNNKRIIGSVPVEEDGSVYFTVPADTFVYFQLLDDQGMMVQSMRSGTIVRPGETIGCTGCHEGRRSSVTVDSSRQAMAGPPQPLEAWHGPMRTFNYAAEVQPVWDRNCVECHDYGKPAGAKLNLAGDQGLMFNTSYVELRKKGYVRVVGAGPFRTQLPKSWGSHASPVVQQMLKGHGDPEIDDKIKLSSEDFDRVVTWIDINAPYYPEYASAFRQNRYGRAPITNAQLARLSELTGMKLSDQKFCAEVSFTRPAMSRCLHKIEDKTGAAYAEALAIIETGKQTLATTPRADMEGFCLVDPIEIEQEKKYQQRLAIETQMRQSIAGGRIEYERAPEEAQGPKPQ